MYAQYCLDISSNGRSLRAVKAHMRPHVSSKNVFKTSSVPIMQVISTSRPVLLLVSLSIVVTVLYVTRQNNDGLSTLAAYRILDEKGTEDFLSKYALYDNRDGSMASAYKLNNPNATDYSETGDKTLRILKHLNGLVNIIQDHICCDKP
jgi:hypothetical protein